MDVKSMTQKTFQENQICWYTKKIVFKRNIVLPFVQVVVYLQILGRPWEIPINHGHTLFIVIDMQNKECSPYTRILHVITTAVQATINLPIRDK
jgi:hypothetical protein